MTAESGEVDFNAFPLTAIDRQILAMTDEDRDASRGFNRTPANNRLEQLKRRPSDLRRYLAWSQDIKARYGGITAFVVQERLNWVPLPSESPSDPPTFSFKNATPFADKDDFKVLRNDWPYGFASGITHFCVWLKTPIATDPSTGDVTAMSRTLIETFVNDTFTDGLDAALGPGKGQDRVLWFKNWVALQSVRGVDHVHVLVRDAPDRLIEKWTGEYPTGP
ncbi:hypothetical protein MBLNU459_g7538t2 [Dothideomycetes sp. NU459]